MKKDFIKGLIYGVLTNIWIIISVLSFFYFALEGKEEYLVEIISFLATIFLILVILYFVQLIKLLINKRCKEGFILFSFVFLFIIFVMLF